MEIKNLFVKVANYLIHIPNKNRKNGNDYPTPLTKEEYYESFGLCFNNNSKNRGSNKSESETSIAGKAFEFVKETRKFEIENYWKRATYFWAFTASIFAALFIVKDKNINDLEFSTICLGLIVSFAWHLTNIGSKSWQRHWEKHLDLMEDFFIGPLYKTINYNITYSVTKINEIVSFSFIIVWMFLGIDYLVSNTCPVFKTRCGHFDWKTTFILIGTFLAIISMFFGHGRGRFKTQEVKMYRRSFRYD